MLAGRRAERRRLADLLDGAHRSTSGVLVLRGEAGVGKTALLDDLVAGADGVTVLRGRGVESEAELPYAALHRLLRPVLAVADGLAAPQADALRVAFGLRHGRADDRFLVSLAALGLLAELGEQRPVLCVLDDAHWLDGASAAALAFVARRLAAEAVAIVFAVRTTDAHRIPLGDLPTLDVPALDPHEADELLASCATAVHPDVRMRLVTATGGNPLALVELARVLDPAHLRGTAPLPDPLPLTAGVERAFLDRVRLLPKHTQRLLLVAAADDTGRLATVLGAAARLGADPSALAAAEQATIVRVGATTVEFRHPLVRSAVYQGATFTERRAAHQALADALDGTADVDRRAWHRAAAAVEPDPLVVVQLDEAAERARARGALTASAAAYGRAAELTADRGGRARRLTAAATDLWRVGQVEQAGPLLGRARALADDDAMRGTIEQLRGLMAFSLGDIRSAYVILRTAAEQIGPNDPARALELLNLAGEAASLALDTEGVVALGSIAVRLPVGDGPRERFLVDLLVGLSHAFAGDPRRAVERLTAAIRTASALDDPLLLLAGTRAAHHLGDDAAALRFSATAAARGRTAGEIAYLPLAGPRLALSEIFAGRLAAAVATATEVVELSHATHLSEKTSHVAAVLWLGLVAALRGEERRCRELVAEALRMAGPHSMGVTSEAAGWTLGVLEMGLGNADAALAHLRHLRHPMIVGFASLDRIEAAHQAGDDAAARAWLADLEVTATCTGKPWALARAAHACGLLEPAEVDRHFSQALAHHGRSGRPFEWGRTELAYGGVLRRARRRTDARRHLRAAFDRFEAIGARPWADRAQAELRACGQTVRRRVAGGPIEQLTPQEVQVARFVSRGLTNAEVAAQLFLSRRTVDFHLRNAFAKLGITSRTELVRLVLDSE